MKKGADWPLNKNDEEREKKKEDEGKKGREGVKRK